MRKLLGVFLLSVAAAWGTPASAESAKAINFQFTDINGKALKLSDFKGKWVLVNFWAPWCPLCWVEVPSLNDLNKRKDFVVIGIGLDYGPDESVVRDAAGRHNLEFHAVVAGGARRNSDSPFRQVGPVDFYPTSYLYDPSGEIVMFIPGQLRVSKVLAFMDEHSPKGSSSQKGAGTQFADHKGQESASALDGVKDVAYSKPVPAAPESQKKKAASDYKVRPSQTVTY